MSRLFRKLQKEKDAQKLAENTNIVVENTTEENPQMNYFDLLTAKNDSVEQGVEKEPEEKEPLSLAPIRSKQKKKKKEKRMTVPTVDEDVDLAIQQVNAQLGFLPMEVSTSPSTKEHETLFMLEMKYFDAELELNREFGIGTKQKKAKRGIVPKKPGWPIVPSFGVSMRLVIEDEGIKYFEFSHSQQYSNIQKIFEQCISTHNPQAFMNLLGKYPYHLDSLLQLSEVFKQQGDASAALDYVQRSIFYLELCFHHSFRYQLGNCRLLYDIPENRTFHLAIFRYIEFISKQGCWRTALELQKLLYTLDPEFDPLCTLYGLDILAIKAKEFEWLSKFQNTVQLEDAHPGAAFSLALCNWELERKRGFVIIA
jgi:hypothetical protein